MTVPSIRPGRQVDLDGVISVLWDVAAEGRWIGPEVPFDRAAFKARMLQNLGRPDHLLLVAEADGTVVGELTLELATYNTADLGMALRTEWRRQGLGKALLAAGVDWARTAGAHKIALEVWPDNDAARALYANHGFVEEGRKRGHYRRRNGDVWDSVLMGLPLNRSPWPVRPATDDDGWDLVALIAACWSEYSGCVMDPTGECPELLTPESSLAGTGARLWVVEGPVGEVIASVGIGAAADGGAELLKLYVARRWRRRGLAGHLAGMVEAEAVRWDARWIELWSDTRFTDAHQFYLTLGYRHTGATRHLDDLSNTVEAHFLKDLNPG